MNWFVLQEREQLELINEIASAMFDDEMVNWGRIVTLHAFCAYLARSVVLPILKIHINLSVKRMGKSSHVQLIFFQNPKGAYLV